MSAISLWRSTISRLTCTIPAGGAAITARCPIGCPSSESLHSSAQCGKIWQNKRIQLGGVEMRLGVLGLVAALCLASCTAIAPQRQAGLPVETIQIETAGGPKAFTVEIAADAVSQERGLMFRR